MKNTLFIILAGLLFSFSAEAQKKKVKTKEKFTVPESVNTSFKGTYSDVADSKWSKNYTGYYVADFTNATSQKQIVEYNSNGTVVKSRTYFDVNTLPEMVSTSLQARYAGVPVKELVRVEIPGVAPYYKATIENSGRKKELFISEQGIITE
ncbi:MAG: PepSY-like domain-containing protein [Ferruginibacter sp.]